MTIFLWFVLGMITPLLIWFGFLWEFNDGRKGWQRLLGLKPPTPEKPRREPRDHLRAMSRSTGGGPGRGFTKPPAGGPSRTRGGNRKRGNV